MNDGRPTTPPPGYTPEAWAYEQATAAYQATPAYQAWLSAAAKLRVHTDDCQDCRRGATCVAYDCLDAREREAFERRGGDES